MSLPSSQLGVFIKGPEPSFTVETHPVPSPGPGEVLVKIKAVAINPTDCKLLFRHRQLFSLRSLLGKMVVFGVAKPGNGSGNDYAGLVVAVGSGVDNVTIGDRVKIPRLNLELHNSFVLSGCWLGPCRF